MKKLFSIVFIDYYGDCHHAIRSGNKSLSTCIEFINYVCDKQNKNCPYINNDRRAWLNKAKTTKKLKKMLRDNDQELSIIKI